MGLANRAIQSFVERGDISLLSTEERVYLYASLCERYGLDPVTRPFDVIELKGKLVLYANRGATDAIARNLGVTREVTVKPSFVDVMGCKVALCEARATYLGRAETSTATEQVTVMVGGKPELLKGMDLGNVLMKVETKAKRRATLAVAGLGNVLDYSEATTVAPSVLPSPDVTLSLEAPSMLSYYVELALSDARITGPANTRDVQAWKALVARFANDVNVSVLDASVTLANAVKAKLHG